MTGEAANGQQEHVAEQSGPEPLPQQRVRSKIELSGRADVEAYVLPKARTVPPYKAWIYLMRNELAAETGRRMFYTDKTGRATHGECHAHT